MPVVCNSYANDTVPITRCEIEQHRICTDHQADPGIDPTLFWNVLIDALYRINQKYNPGQKLSAFTPADILTVTNNARCCVSEGSHFACPNEDKMMGLALTLANNILCSAP